MYIRRINNAFAILGAEKVLPCIIKSQFPDTSLHRELHRSSVKTTLQVRGV